MIPLSNRLQTVFFIELYPPAPTNPRCSYHPEHVGHHVGYCTGFYRGHNCHQCAKCLQSGNDIDNLLPSPLELLDRLYQHYFPFCLGLLQKAHLILRVVWHIWYEFGQIHELLCPCPLHHLLRDSTLSWLGTWEGPTPAFLLPAARTDDAVPDDFPSANEGKGIGVTMLLTVLSSGNKLRGGIIPNRTAPRRKKRDNPQYCPLGALRGGGEILPLSSPCESTSLPQGGGSSRSRHSMRALPSHTGGILPLSSPHEGCFSSPSRCAVRAPPSHRRNPHPIVTP